MKSFSHSPKNPAANFFHCKGRIGMKQKIKQLVLQLWYFIIGKNNECAGDCMQGRRECNCKYGNR